MIPARGECCYGFLCTALIDSLDGFWNGAIGMPDVSGDGGFSRPAATPDGCGGHDAAPSTNSGRIVIEPVFRKTFYVGLVTTLLFALLGSSNVLATYVEQAQWLITKMAPVWPALPPQYEMVLRIRGPGHAASFGFMCVALWTWPAVAAVAFLREHVRRRESISPISWEEKRAFILLFPFCFFLLWIDTTPPDTFVFGRLYPDQWGFFYLRSFLLFSGTALALAVLVYVIGRIILDRNWRRPAA